MYGSILSVLLMGMLPMWGLAGGASAGLPPIEVSPPAAWASASGGELSFSRELSASGVLVMDADSGQAIYGDHADTPRPMASLTKIMTALLIVEHHSLDERVTIPVVATEVEGNVVHLPAGDEFTVGDLLSALLIMSANDAAITLAQYHSGSVAAFVEEMNARARSLGLQDTVYKNPIGLDAEGQESTPRELAWLTMFALRHPEIAKRMGTRVAQIESLKDRKIIFLSHTHALLHTNPAIIAGKTGTTTAAGQCLLSVVKEGRKHLIVVLLRSGDRYSDMRTILEGLAIR